MIAKEQLSSLIPHAGDMCLLHAVEDWTADHIECTAHAHSAPEHPLRRAGQLSALHLIEYAAQAIAAHGALLAHSGDGRSNHRHDRVTPRAGMLAVLREVKFYSERIDTLDGMISIAAQRRFAREDGVVYDFAARGDGRILCEGRVVIALQRLGISEDKLVARNAVDRKAD